jgi:putative ABC transport system ATP-binding protein
MITLCDVRKSVPLANAQHLDILRGVNLDVHEGESVAILGRSGSGKTTLLNIIGLIDTPDSGTYEIDGNDVNKLSERARAALRGTHFGFIFQNFLLFPRRSVLANVTAPLFHAPRTVYRRRTEIGRRLLRGLGLEDRVTANPGQLSGGEQQRVAIARSLSRAPKCVLADEPTGSLDVETGAQVLDMLFAAVRERGMSLILITHDNQIAALADRVLKLEAGVLGAPA